MVILLTLSYACQNQETKPGARAIVSLSGNKRKSWFPFSYSAALFIIDHLNSSQSFYTSCDLHSKVYKHHWPGFPHE